MTDKITWILTATLEGFNHHEHCLCSDNLSLEDPIYLEEMLGFIKQNGYEIYGHIHPKINKYHIGLTCCLDEFKNWRMGDFIRFRTGRYSTSSIYHFDKEKGIREKLYGIF